MGCHGRWQASRSLRLRRVRAQAPDNTVSFRVTPERKLTSGYGTLLDLDTAAAAECSHDNATTHPKDATMHSNSPMGSDIGTTGLVAQTHRALAWSCPRNSVDKPVISHVA